MSANDEVPWFRVRQVSPVVSALASRGFSSLLNLAVNVLVGRVLGATGAGVFYLFVSWTNLLGTVGSVGLPSYTMRSVASLAARGERGVARRTVQVALKAVVLIGIALAASVVLSAGLLAGTLLGSRDLSGILVSAAAAGIPLAATRVLAETLKAEGRPSLGLAAEFALPPAVLLVLLSWAFAVGQSVSVEPVVAGYVVGLTIAAAISYLPAMRLLPRAGQGRVPPPPVRVILPLWGTALVNSAFMAAPYLVLPHFVAPSQIGHFGAAHRLVSLSGTILGALASLFGPLFAREFSVGNVPGVLRQYRISQVYSLGAYAPFLVAFTVFAAPVLALFGGDFEDAKGMLVVLALGRVINSTVGVAEYVLNMTGRERAELLNAVSALGCFFGSALIFGRTHGALGIAWSYAATMALRSVASYVVVRRSLVGR